MKGMISREKRIRIFLLIFVAGLTISGLTAIPVHQEAAILNQLFGSASQYGKILPGFSIWVDRIYEGIQNGYGNYPFLAYGTDWLAFGHIAIAIAFVGPLRDPIRNIWVIEFGMIACVLVIPWAILFGLIRGIPPFWTMVDMSFGVFGIIPLWLARRDIHSITGNQTIISHT